MQRSMATAEQRTRRVQRRRREEAEKDRAHLATASSDCTDASSSVAADLARPPMLRARIERSEPPTRNSNMMSHSLRARLPRRVSLLAAVVTALVATAGRAQIPTQGPSSSRAPYMVSTAPAGVSRGITSIVTTTDLVQKTGALPGTTFEFGGIPDGIGAFDNGDGTITVLMNHELLNTQGAVRAHGAIGAYVEAMIVDKSTLAVVSSADLIEHVVDGAGIVHDGAHSNAIAFSRFCSADLPPVSAFYNAQTGLGTQDRIYLHGEEGSVTGWAQATPVTGPERGISYTLAKMNLTTNGSGLTGVGAWENQLANPTPQDSTVVVGTSDGGTGIMTNAVVVYVGTKQNVGNAAEKAGLTNGTLSFVNVTGSAAEIVNTVTRATNIVSGTRFSLSGTTSTTFSRPEDGAWNPADPRQFYFVTTDRLDNVTATGPNPTSGATGAVNQTGMSRLWRLTFDDIGNPSLGGVIDLLVDGGKNGTKVQMFDNMTVAVDGRGYLNEDPGNSTYIGKVWCYDPATDTLVQLAKFDPALWGDLAAAGGTPGAIAPHTSDKETSGIVDVTSLFATCPGETVLLFDVQDHSTNPAVATAASVEGGQLLLLRTRVEASVVAFGVRCGTPGLSLVGTPGALPRIGATVSADIGNVPAGHVAMMAVGFSDTDINGTPLPVSLAIFGLPECFLYHDAGYGNAFATTPTSATTARYSVAVPNSEVFVGLHAFFQAWSTDGVTFAASNALRLHVGF